MEKTVVSVHVQSVTADAHFIIPPHAPSTLLLLESSNPHGRAGLDGDHPIQRVLAPDASEDYVSAGLACLVLRTSSGAVDQRHPCC